MTGGTMTDPTRPAWWDRFVDAHGERFVFMGGATVFAIMFVILGLKIEGLAGLVDAGNTILIGIGMLLFNKARGGDQK
jgi:hypothetical protein